MQFMEAKHQSHAIDSDAAHQQRSHPPHAQFQSQPQQDVFTQGQSSQSQGHFGYGPSTQRKSTAPSPAENWYTSLITDNARRQGSFNPYGNLDGIAFTIPALLSVEAFLKALISVFGNRFMKENAKRALSACKQGTSTIGEYNSRFSSLVYLVEDVEEARIKRYVSGLNPRIISQAMSKELRNANTLDTRMELATEAAAQLNLLSLLPSDSNQNPQQLPFSSAPPPGLSFPPPAPNTPL
ncbi:hypothetical protein PCANC_18760 [Puccinia coronata f. sp. avenae]|uniref:Retrotransposon gag domain-containing protein n=1 Tax=Puccinia coronata f. sp. avenae TaxID=200324 RepID=A0A2N5UEA4_9BASI|nr:hypothetical protein PCANC_18760 [Puccinia coronata f. sp. avenae]